MNKVAFILPGFGYSAKREEYQLIGRYFQQRGIKPVYVEVKWKYSTISKNVSQFIKLLKETKADHKYILGFSFGAVIAFLSATQEKVDTLILCSLSPYFSEDLDHIKDTWKKYIGKKRLKDFEQISNSKLASKVNTETYLLFGTKEVLEVEKRVKDTYASLRHKKHLICIDGVKHKLEDERYLKRVKQIISQL